MSHTGRRPPEDATSHTCIGSTRGRRLKFFEAVSCEITFRDGLLCAGCRCGMKTAASVQLCLILERQGRFCWRHLQTITQTFEPGKDGHPLSIPLPNPPPGVYRAVSYALARDSSGRLVEGVWVASAETISI